MSTQQVTAIIFSEHQKLSNENSLLKQQVFSLEELNKLHLKTDSIQGIEVKELKERVVSDKEKIQKLKSTQKKTILGASVGGVFLFILGLLL